MQVAEIGGWQFMTVLVHVGYKGPLVVWYSVDVSVALAFGVAGLLLQGSSPEQVHRLMFM